MPVQKFTAQIKLKSQSLFNLKKIFDCVNFVIEPHDVILLIEVKLVMTNFKTG